MSHQHPAICLFFEARCEYLAHIGLELVILLPQPPESWDYRCAPPWLVKDELFTRWCWDNHAIYIKREPGPYLHPIHHMYINMTWIVTTEAKANRQKSAELLKRRT
jgi:hypothetical protein